MKLLLVAATLPEIQPILTAFGMGSADEEKQIGAHQVKALVTGAGMVPTAFSLGRYLSQHSFDLVINLGIAGSFDFNLDIGEVCIVTQDTFAELGAEDGEEFLSFDSLGLGISSQHQRQNPGFDTSSLKTVTAITVNKVHGNELSIATALARFNPQIETMEGAAFFYACTQNDLPCIQIRAVSNYVERRNRENWKIDLAIQKLNDVLINLLKR